MAVLVTEDIKKLYDAIRCINKTFHCAVCHRLPPETRTAKCGHPFCKSCLEKLLEARKATCTICKKVITRNAVRAIESLDKVRKDLDLLTDAIDKDLDALTEDKPKEPKRYPGKLSKPNLPTPTTSFNKLIVQDASSGTDSDVKLREEIEKLPDARKISAQKLVRKVSIDSEETIKIRVAESKSTKKREEAPYFAEPTTSKATNRISEPVFTTDNVSNEFGAIGYKKKVEDWLNFGEFAKKTEQREEFPDFEKSQRSNSPSLSEVLQSFSQMKQEYSNESIKSGRTSRASKTPKKNERERAASIDDNNEKKFRSFTFEATNKKKSVSNAPAPEDILFDKLRRKTIEDERQSKKLKAHSELTESSWCELERFKKETNPRVRKRRRLNVSIERPRPVAESSEFVDSEEETEEKEEEARDTYPSENRSNKQSQSNEKMDKVERSTKKRKKSCILSQRTLEPNEMIDMKKLSRCQVIEIIGGPNPSTSKNSINSPEKLNENKLSPKRHSRDKGMEEEEEEGEANSNIREQSRPQSEQSIHTTNDASHPCSRLSCRSPGKATSSQYKLSIDKRLATPQPRQEDNEGTEKIVIKKNSPVRISNDIIRNKLSLKRLSSGSSRMTDAESRNSGVVFKKIGKLHKLKKNIKFIRLGYTKTEAGKRKLQIATRNTGTQTSPRYDNVNSNSKNVNNINYSSSESMPRVIIPETRTVSAVSSNLKQIEEAQIAPVPDTSSRAVARHNPPGEFDTVNRVNLLSPEKDSQLKFLATKSPSVPRMHDIGSDKLVRKIGKSYTSMKGRETSFNKSAIETSEPDEYSRAIKKRGEKLIVTDSEDQDTPNETGWEYKHKNDHESSPKKRIFSATSCTTSKTVSKLSNINQIDDKIEAGGNDNAIIIRKSSPVKGVGNNNSGEKLSRESPRKTKYSRESSRSENRRQSVEKLKLSVNKSNRSYCDESSESDADTILFRKSKAENQDAHSQHLEDSNASIINGRRKVARTLKYSQESGKNCSEIETMPDNKKEKKNNHEAGEKKTFRRIRELSSSDSGSDLLVISQTTKLSSSNSHAIVQPRISQVVTKSPIPSEDMTVIFSNSNKDTQESKRKRSPSSHSLNNNELQAIASNWCADLGTSSEEIIPTNQRTFKFNEKHLSNNTSTPSKKPRIEARKSPASFDSDNLPALSPTAIYGPKSKGLDQVETAARISSQSSIYEEGMSIDDLDAVVRQFDDIDENNHQPKKRARNSGSRNDKKHVGSAEHKGHSIEQGNTIPLIVTGSINSATIKAKSSEDRGSAGIQMKSQSSDKENEIKNQSAKKRENDRELFTNTGQGTSSHEDLNKLKGIEGKDIDKLNLSNNSEVLESSFDRDCFNITLEEKLLQEVEDNLLGRNPKQQNNNKQTIRDKTITEKSQEKSVKEPEIDNADQNTRGYKVAQINAEDSDTMDEGDIIESTPDKNSSMKKDLYARTENSQRSNASLKSFMSMNMTPIPKVSHQNMGLRSNVASPLEAGSKSSTNNLKNTYHSTPKAIPTPSCVTLKKSNLLGKCIISVSDPSERAGLCFVCSCLPLSQVQTVKDFARKHGVDYTASYIPEVTHVIVETNDKNSAARTLKYLLGVAHKKWIVSYQWVIDSMNSNRILDEEKYEAIDSDTEEPGPSRSRLSKTGLFDDFAFVCMKPFTDITVEQLQDLLTSTGGTVVQTLEELASVRNKHKVILYNSDIHIATVLDNWLRKGKGVPIIVEWVLSSISQYNLISFRYYLQMDPNVLSDFHYPECVIAEDDEEDGVIDISV